jgi:hypothetical protein
MTKDKPSKPVATRLPDDGRQARLAAALRANLQKRKALSRAKAGRPEPGEDGPDETAS